MEFTPNMGTRDRFMYEDFLIGLGDGVIMRSYDMGLNWEEWLDIRCPWSYASIQERSKKCQIFFLD